MKIICICRHLTKLFDSMAKLKFKPGEPSEGTHAEGMIAKDGEYVKFSKECDCNGPVSEKSNEIIK